MRRMYAVGAVALLATGAALAQNIISAHSGVVQYVEGRVLLNNKPVVEKFGQFPEIKEGQVFATEDGRAEILLTPGVFLRVPENSSVRMIDRSLTNTRVEVLSGAALVECAEILKDDAVSLVYKGWTVALEKKGLYRLDTDPARLRVFEGEAGVAGDGHATLVKRSRELYFGPLLADQRFNSKETDELYSWSARRAESLSMASISAAKSLRDDGSSWGVSGWDWNPWFGMFTFVPYRGIYNSPFGYSFWSPLQVGYFYQPGYYYGGGGYNTRTAPTTSAVNWSPHYDSNLGYNTASRATFAQPSVGMQSSGSSSMSGMSGRGGMSSAGTGGGASSGRGASNGGGRGR
ncbi:MAG: hypothetical protein ABI165_14530 [Bryobacteraceae bacterium]